MNKTIELPEHAEKAHRVVVGISRNENKQRVVYVYWHHSKLPGRTDWVHNETDGDIRWLADSVIDALCFANPDMAIFGSSSLDFPDDE